MSSEWLRVAGGLCGGVFSGCRGCARAGALALLCFSLHHATAALAQADTGVGATVAVTDTAAFYRASGSLTATDGANDGVAEQYAPVDPAPPPGGPFWDIDILYQTSGWTVAGAASVRIRSDGFHLKGPHPPPDFDPNDTPNNGLNEIGAPPLLKPAKAVAFLAANRKQFSAYGVTVHPTNRPNQNHFDHLGFRAEITALAGPAPPGGHQLTGGFEITAKHTTSTERPKEFKGYAFGATSLSGATVSFDALTGLLSFSIPGVDILDAVGGQTEAVDPAFAGDPVTQAQFHVSPLQFLGQDAYGRYQFGGGTIDLSDPSANFEWSGAFGGYLVANTTGVPMVTSFALLDELGVVDVEDPGLGPSAFLDAFAGQHLLGQGLTESEWLELGGIVWTFVTPFDLAQTTNGFTESTVKPATIRVAGAVFEPPPAVPALGGAGIAVVALFLFATGAAALLGRGVARS